MRNIIKKLGTLIGVRRTLNFIEGVGTTNNISDNSDKGTSIIALRIA